MHPDFEEEMTRIHAWAEELRDAVVGDDEKRIQEALMKKLICQHCHMSFLAIGGLKSDARRTLRCPNCGERIAELFV